MLMLLNLHSDPEAVPEYQADDAAGSSFAGGAGETALDCFNPFEALVEDPRGAIVILLLIAGSVGLVLLAGALCL
jgi:hypothetical protein